jgi:tRNA threonylcarbamoyladenosine biosynthesis protein TsaB
VILVVDTATAATVAGVADDAGTLLAERRHDPAPGERPGHGTLLLALADEVLRAAGAGWSDVTRLGVGVGPGTFTGMRIGVATARALAQGLGAEVAPVSTLEAVALGAREAGASGNVLAVLDARRGEAFVAAWDAAGARVLEPAAWRPERLAEVPAIASGPWLAAGGGAVQFREDLEAADVLVPGDGAACHRVGAGALARLAAEGPTVDRDALVPEYVRPPDATPRR